MIVTPVVQHSRTERPSHSCVPGVHKPPSIVTPSMVECQGRTTSVAFSEFNGDVIGGGDVAATQRASIVTGLWRGYSAGGGNDGVGVAYPNKKTCCFVEGPTYALWLSGSNGSGAIWRRDVTDTLWDLATEDWWGTVNDGGSANPRRSGSSLAVIDGTTCFMSAERVAAPTNGIARSTDSGATWSAWSVGTSRNYTSLRKSPNWDYILAASDGRVGASQDGVWLHTGLASGSATVVQWDTIGTGAPDLADVRNLFVVDENGDDCWFVVVGNAAGSDADRGIWRLRVTHDPLDGGFVAATHMTWTHIFTPGTNDRVQACVAYQPNGSTQPEIYLAAVYFNGSTVATGTYDLSVGAGGSTQTYRVRAVRTLNAEAASPSFEVISNEANVDIRTFGTDHDHVISYVGEQSNEKGRMGGSSYQGQDLAISADGQSVVACGKSSPWICNPWVSFPSWRPFSRGLGLLEGGYASVYVTDIGDGRIGVAFADDDRGMYTFNSLHLQNKGPEWVVAENIDGAITTDNAMNGISVDVGTPLTLLLPRRLNGRAYRVTDAWDYDNALITAITPDSSANPPAIGAFAWVDTLTTDRRLVVNVETAWRDSTVVLSSFSSAAKRTEFQVSGANAFLLIPDEGIFRSNDNGLTWLLWWDYGITDSTTNRYAGHIALEPSDTLYVTWDEAGVWECANAATSAVGSGLVGSRPADTNKITSGDLATTDFVSAIDYDAGTGELWGCGYDPTGATANVLYVRRAGGPWQAISDREYAESAIIPQALTAFHGLLLIGTASNGTLLRMIS